MLKNQIFLVLKNIRNYVRQYRNLSTQYDKKLSKLYVEERKANSRTHGINNDDATITGMASNKSISITISTNNN
jgi:hypothetical protein